METSGAASSNRARVRRAAGWLLSAALLGCASTPLNGHTYRNDEVSFELGPYPDRWRQIGSDDVLVAFRDDGDDATIAINGRCGKDADDVPLEALTQHLFLEFTDRKLIGQERTTLASRAALRTEIVAALDGVSKHYVVYVLKKDGCVYDFMYIASLGSSNDERAAFDEFVRGFRTTR